VWIYRLWHVFWNGGSSNLASKESTIIGVVPFYQMTLPLKLYFHVSGVFIWLCVRVWEITILPLGGFLRTVLRSPTLRPFTGQLNLSRNSFLTTLVPVFRRTGEIASIHFVLEETSHNIELGPLHILRIQKIRNGESYSEGEQESTSISNLLSYCFLL